MQDAPLVAQPVLIRTPRLILREFRTDDLVAYQRIHAHPKFKRFYSEADTSPARAAELLERFIAQSRQQPRLKYQLAITGPGDNLMGSCGVRIESPDERQGSFGCELDCAYQAQGYAAEAGRAILQFGFTKLRLHRIYAETLSENHAAVALARKLGMQVEGELRDHRWFRNRWWSTTLLAAIEPGGVTP